jgi:hypothetical protein
MTQVLSLYKFHKIAANLSPLIHRPFGFNVDDTGSEFIQFSQNRSRPISLDSSSPFGFDVDDTSSEFIQFAQNNRRPPLIHRPFGFNVDDTSSEFIQFAQNSSRPISLDSSLFWF